MKHPLNLSKSIHKINQFGLLTIILIYSILFLCTSGNEFFWDTTQLASKHGHWYYENNFKYLLLPNHLDSGHIPAFGMYIALMWKLFEKSLFISHLAIFPFTLGILYQVYKLLLNIDFPKKWVGIGCL